MTTKLLANQLNSLMKDPVEGFTVELVNESSLYEWKVYLEGPKDTFYEGGVFQLLLTFPKDYPMSPPSLRFLSEFWHPNVYQKEGKVCISILHPPGEDALSGELPQERWLPTQTVSTIILSVMSILSDPNCSSPANVDASVEWRQNREAYKKRCAKLVEKANAAKPAHIVIPHPDTNPEEHKKSVERIKMAERGMDIDYFEMDEDDYNNYDDDDDDENDDDDDNDDDQDDDDEDGVDDDDEEDAINRAIHSTSNHNINNDDHSQTTTTTVTASAVPTNIIVQQDSENTTPQCIENFNLSPVIESVTSSSIENTNNNTNNSNDNSISSLVEPTTTTTTTTIPSEPSVEPTITTIQTTAPTTTTELSVAPPTESPTNNDNDNHQDNVNNTDNMNRKKKKSKKCIIM